MSKSLMAVIGIVIMLVVICGGAIAYVLSAKFTAEGYEQSIYAQDENMQNVHSSMKNALKMQGFTVKNYTESDIKKMEVAIQRYADKPQLMMQWAQESNNGLSPALHEKFMDAIEKFYVKWERTQGSKISVAQEYRTYLKATIKGSISTMIFNYPTEKAKTIMDRIISSKDTKNAWDTGEDEAIDVFGNQKQN